MDYMKEIKEISAEQAIILWQTSRLSLSKIYEKTPEILKMKVRSLAHWAISVHPSAKPKVKDFQCIGYRSRLIEKRYGTAVCCRTTGRKRKDSLCGHRTKPLSLSESHETYFTACWSSWWQGQWTSGVSRFEEIHARTAYQDCRTGYL